MKKTTRNPRMAQMTKTSESAASDLVRRVNRCNSGITAVVVDGPDDGEFTVMDLRDAIDNEFLYRWEV